MTKYLNSDNDILSSLIHKHIAEYLNSDNDILTSWIHKYVAPHIQYTNTPGGREYIRYTEV